MRRRSTLVLDSSAPLDSIFFKRGNRGEERLGGILSVLSPRESQQARKSRRSSLPSYFPGTCCRPENCYYLPTAGSAAFAECCRAPRPSRPIGSGVYRYLHPLCESWLGVSERLFRPKLFRASACRLINVANSGAVLTVPRINCTATEFAALFTAVHSLCTLPWVLVSDHTRTPRV